FVGGLISLLFMLGFIIVDPNSGKTVLGIDPVLPFDAAEHQHDRFVGPFSALWLIVFSMPFFILTPDLGASSSPSTSALKDGIEQLKQTFRELGKYVNIVIFLIARMIYNDGLTAIFTFGGIYATAIFQWSLIELGLFGIILIVVGAIGAYFGGKLDDRLGSKTLIMSCLVLLLLASIGILSVDQNRILFVLEVSPRSEGAIPLSSTGELVYLAFACIVGLVGGPLQASSRTLLARLAPPDKLSEFFGLYAFSGKVTAFMAPFVVASVTSYYGDQRLGIATVLIFLIVGFIMMLWVRSTSE
ncbi:MAG: MFS transporter, partial [Methyloligellaceae bacterium]